MDLHIYFIYYTFLFIFTTGLYFIYNYLTAAAYLISLYKSFFVFFMTGAVFYFLINAMLCSYTLMTHTTFFMSTSIYLFPYMYIFGLVTTISCLFCFLYKTSENVFFFWYLIVIIGAGWGLFWTTNIILFFFMYELLLLPSFIILYKFAKTRRCVEAAYLMFFWTQLGAILLLFVIYYIFILTGALLFTQWEVAIYTSADLYICFWLLFFGFGVKFPIWPFYGWLPRAHVEASTNFSIFLSGVLVKFAFLGFFKFLLCFNQVIPTFGAYAILVFGLIDAAFKLFYQIDLKKIIAYATVIEMHWLTICILSTKAIFFWAGAAMLTSHAILSTNAFLLVDAATRRFKTRLLTELGGLCWLTPKLFLLTFINLLIFLGIPGTLFFVAEFLFLYALCELHYLFALLFFIYIYLLVPTFFFRSFSNALFGLCFNNFKMYVTDLVIFELILYGLHIFLLFYLGLTWQCILYV